VAAAEALVFGGNLGVDFFLLSDDVCQCVAMPHVWLRSRSDPHVTVLGLAITNQLRNLEPNREKTQILRLSV
jgi:hypothetical protein